MLDVSESVLRIHTMIAGKDIAVMLDYDGTAALLRMDTDRGRVPDPGVKGPLEVHHKDISHIVTHPLIVDRYQKVAILLGDHRPWRYFDAVLPPSSMRLARPGEDPFVCLRIGQALNYRRELDEFYPLTLEEVVYVKGIARCLPGNTGQHIIFDFVFLQVA